MKRALTLNVLVVLLSLVPQLPAAALNEPSQDADPETQALTEQSAAESLPQSEDARVQESSPKSLLNPDRIEQAHLGLSELAEDPGLLSSTPTTNASGRPGIPCHVEALTDCFDGPRPECVGFEPCGGGWKWVECGPIEDPTYDVCDECQDLPWDECL